MKYLWTLIVLAFMPLGLAAQTEPTIEIGTFNMEWFPCKDDGEMMKKYNINLRYPPKGNATNMKALFDLLKELDIELLGVQEVVDPQLLEKMAKEHLGEEFEVIYSSTGGSQKVGFLYDSSVLELVGEPETYASLLLKPDSWLRPAYRAYFRSKPNGFDFHAVVLHLKASPSGWKKREKQLQKLEDILESLPKKSGDSDIVVMGDMNNVTKAGAGEFLPMLKRLDYYWATGDMDGKPSNYWKPDWKVDRLQASLIDHIFISADAKIEFVAKSTSVGGACAAGAEEYIGDKIPSYFDDISDHCPVYASFKFKVDND